MKKWICAAVLFVVVGVELQAQITYISHRRADWSKITNIPTLLQEILDLTPTDGGIMVGNGSGWTVEVRPRPRYPVFVLEVPYGAPWTDFEIKASETNFGADGSPDMVYYYHSPGSTGTEVGDLPDVWFTDSGATDRREWLAQDNTPTRNSIASMLTDVNSEVGGIVVVITDSAVANKAAANDLIFSYSWLDSTSSDEDPAGRSIWRPIVPTTWVSETYQP